MRYVKQFSNLMILALSLSYIVFAQEQKKESKEDQEVIKLQSMLVQIPVVVSDKGGRYITDLTVKDFQLYEDGIEQQISFFVSTEEPFNVVLLLDSSGSMLKELEGVKQAAMAFIESLRSVDRGMVISFSDSVQIQCEMTGDRDSLKRAIRAIRPGEHTQVYEAVYTAVWEKLSEIKGRKAVILFTDGIDTASSEIEEDDTFDAVIESEEVIIYPIRYGTKKDKATRAAAEYLEKLAVYSGGISEQADELSDLGKAFSRIADELRRQYVVGYYPARLAASDNIRKIKLILNREGVKIRSRLEYKYTLQ